MINLTDYTMDEFLDALEVYARTETPVGPGLAEFIEIVTEEVISKINKRADMIDIMKAVFANGIFVGMIVAQQKPSDPLNIDALEYNKYLH